LVAGGGIDFSGIRRRRGRNRGGHDWQTWAMLQRMEFDSKPL
jgi:hypothetical protein